MQVDVALPSFTLEASASIARPELVALVGRYGARVDQRWKHAVVGGDATGQDVLRG